MALDLTDPASIKQVYADATARFVEIDVLINDAGYGYRAAFEEGDGGSDPYSQDGGWAAWNTSPGERVRRVFRTDFAGRLLKGAKTEVGDYAATVCPLRKANDRTDGNQPGDRTRPAKLIVEMLSKPKLPKRLLLGRDAAKILMEALQAQLDEIKAASAESASTDFCESELKVGFRARANPPSSP